MDIDFDRNTPQDVNEIYQVLSNVPQDYADSLATRIGQAQQTMPLASKTMGNTTANLGNYTYNRTIRPAVDVARDSLVVNGMTAALNKYLYDELDKAKKNYNRAAGKTNPAPTTTTTTTGFDVEEETTNDVTTGKPNPDDVSDYLLKYQYYLQWLGNNGYDRENPSEGAPSFEYWLSTYWPNDSANPNNKTGE